MGTLSNITLRMAKDAGIDFEKNDDIYIRVPTDAVFNIHSKTNPDLRSVYIPGLGSTPVNVRQLKEMPDRHTIVNLGPVDKLYVITDRGSDGMPVRESMDAGEILERMSEDRIARACSVHGYKFAEFEVEDKSSVFADWIDKVKSGFETAKSKVKQFFADKDVPKVQMDMVEQSDMIDVSSSADDGFDMEKQ